MDLIKETAYAFIMLIPVGAVFRVVYCLIRIGAAEEEGSLFKKRAKNTMIFYILAESIWQIKEIVLEYYS